LRLEWLVSRILGIWESFLSGMLCIAVEIHRIYWPAKGNGIKKENNKDEEKKSVDSCFPIYWARGVKIPSRIPGIESSRISEVPFGLIRC
jgi:hypothetical protein